MLSKSSLKIVLTGIFQFDIPFGSYDRGQPEPIHLRPFLVPPVESHPPWDPSLQFLLLPNPVGT